MVGEFTICSIVTLILLNLSFSKAISQCFSNKHPLLLVFNGKKEMRILYCSYLKYLFFKPINNTNCAMGIAYNLLFLLFVG